MSHHDWKKGFENTQNGYGTAPQKAGESKQAFNDRVGGADAARKQQNK